jgi:predicted nuclease of predicted toxin-antitoxin system
MMQFKTDENLHSDVADLLRQHGHDALTVYEQGLRGAADLDIATVCRQEQRAIVTLESSIASRNS